MKINDWENWYTFSTYLKAPYVDLEAAAKVFVESGFAECVFLRDGMTFWRTENGFQKGETTIKLKPSTKEATFQVTVQDNAENEMTSFGAETWAIGTKFRFSELRLFGEESSLPPPYLRAFLGYMQFIEKEKLIIGCYPIVTLYESGIFLIQFRIIGKSKEVEQFINDDVNIPRRQFDSVEVNPTISLLAPSAYYEQLYWPMSITIRLRLHKMFQIHRTTHHKLIRTEKIGDFNFQLTPLSGEKDQKETITSVAQTLFSIVSYLNSIPRTGIKYILFGNNKPLQLGNYWSGRPHIHIIRHSNQADAASKNEERNKKYFGWIITRSYGMADNGNKFLPKSQRMFEDYSSYIASSSMLWVWSKSGLAMREKWDDKNRGHLIYENEALGCLVEYGYMLNKSLSDSLSEVATVDIHDVLSTRRFIIDLKERMAHSSQYGEVNEFLNEGWDALGLNQTQLTITESIHVLETEAKLLESKRTDRTGKAITILFGLLTVPTFTESVTKPFWKYFGFWRPQDPNLYKLFIIGITTILVLVLVISLIQLLYSKSRRFLNY